ncbi:hypothetical protein J4463_01630 [Candidatus Pacearchaeota archaeon]|nr:hypothetical protein [Candidatus Pacearchaeota archaeon]
MKSKEWVGVIAVVLIVAVVASLVTTSITGDVIRVNKDINGTYRVYTQLEMDQKLTSLNDLKCDGRFLDLAVNKEGHHPKETVYLVGSPYLIELKTATDSAATIKVINKYGNLGSSEVSEAQTKLINGVEVKMLLADESTALSYAQAQMIVSTPACGHYNFSDY